MKKIFNMLFMVFGFAVVGYFLSTLAIMTYVSLLKRNFLIHYHHIAPNYYEMLMCTLIPMIYLLVKKAFGIIIKWKLVWLVFLLGSLGAYSLGITIELIRTTNEKYGTNLYMGEVGGFGIGLIQYLFISIHLVLIFGFCLFYLKDKIE